MKSLQYIIADALEPIHIDNITNKIIIHCCNDTKKWGSGLRRPTVEKWPRN